MSDLKKLKQAVEEYASAFRRPGLPALEVSPLYALFPSDEALPSDVALTWPDVWPHASRQGVYVIFGPGIKLLYIGKASMTNTIGGRLYRWFKYSPSGGCRVADPGWSMTPMYVATIPAPENMPFEAPALEEYLIQTLQPCDNARGREHGEDS